MATIRIDYVNWKGEREWRNITPHRLFFGATDFHRETQWLLDAWDGDKNAPRTFALSGICNPEELVFLFFR